MSPDIRLVGWLTGGVVSVGSAIAPALTCQFATPTLAQIIPDNTLPIPSSVVPGCTLCTIEGGTLRGNNLFHSFTEFSVPTGGTAIFNNSPQLENIFSRVTGNVNSEIDGLIQTNGTTNLFLINPNGIAFGSNASLNIDGSFGASTAHRFEFDSGLNFSATNPEAPPLLTVNVTPGLQFGAVFSPLPLINAGNLAVGQDLTLVAENLDLQGQLYAGNNLTLQAEDILRARDTIENPFVATAGGQLLVQGNQAVDIFALNHPDSGFFSGNDTVLRSNNTVVGDAHYWSNGNFRIENLENRLGTLSGIGNRIIRANGNVSFESYIGPSLHILAGGSVNIGSIVINGAASEETIQDSIALGETAISINGSSQPTLDIRAGTTAVGSPPGIIGNLQPTVGTAGLGQGGDLKITASRLVLRDGAVITSATLGPGQGGALTVVADEWIEIVGANFDEPMNSSGLFSISQGTGSAGDLRVDTQKLIVRDGGQIGNYTVGPGDAGDLDITATESVILLRTLPNIPFATGLITETVGSGNAGNIRVETQRLIMREGAAISSGAFFFNETVETQDLSLGQAGDTTIIAPELVELSGASGERPTNINSETEGLRPGGDLNIETGKLTVRDGALISSNTFSAGLAGKLTINASEMITLVGQGSNDTETGIVAATGQNSNGNGGNLALISPTIRVANGARLAVDSQGAGEGGNIQVTTNSLLLEDGAQILAETQSNIGGEVTLNIGTILLLRTGSRISTNAGTAGAGGDGGNIVIDVHDGFIVAVPDENSDITANAFEGKGGNINISAQALFGIQPRETLTPLSDITASSEFGVSGTIQVNDLNLDPNSGLVELPAALLAPSDLIVQGCDQITVGSASQGEFFTSGRGGMVPLSSDTLSSDDVLEDLRLPTGWTEGDSIGNSITEAQGWFEDDSGEVILSAVPLPKTSRGGCWR
ncbi:filamentous hemagglutinin family N-terminal domain protein [Leptolyngbya sp. PCC 7375]|nr:filamentous hemagglutinin family N-terminal domain protein [Leptolyngbya sp. PCC 7375]